MQVYSGKSVFGGIAIGKISVYKKNEQQVKRVRTEDTKGELARYEAAKAAAVEQLHRDAEGQRGVCSSCDRR